jgi:hypothetical protein
LYLIQAKLGDKNKFYYDEKLKRWVEEGVEAAEEQAPLAPPPISANFGSKRDEAASPEKQFGIGQGSAPPSASKTANLGTPPVPPSNLFSARTKQQGVRSRYQTNAVLNCTLWYFQDCNFVEIS